MASQFVRVDIELAGQLVAAVVLVLPETLPNDHAAVSHFGKACFNVAKGIVVGGGYSVERIGRFLNATVAIVSERPETLIRAPRRFKAVARIAESVQLQMHDKPVGCPGSRRGLIQSLRGVVL
jgi:hypothetical protein